MDDYIMCAGILIFVEDDEEQDLEEIKLVDEVESLIGEVPVERSLAACRAAQHDMKAEQDEETRPAREAREAVRATEEAVKAAKRSLRTAQSAQRKADKLEERIAKKAAMIERLRFEIGELTLQEETLRVHGGSEGHVEHARRALEAAEEAFERAKKMARIFED